MRSSSTILVELVRLVIRISHLWQLLKNTNAEQLLKKTNAEFTSLTSTARFKRVKRRGSQLLVLKGSRSLTQGHSNCAFLYLTMSSINNNNNKKTSPFAPSAPAIDTSTLQALGANAAALLGGGVDANATDSTGTNPNNSTTPTPMDAEDTFSLAALSSLFSTPVVKKTKPAMSLGVLAGRATKTGDLDLFARPITFGKQIILINDPSDLCLARVGKQGKFCCLLKRACSTSSHSSPSVVRVNEDLFPGLFMKAAKPNADGSVATAFLEPTLKVDQSTDMVMLQGFLATDIDDAELWNDDFAAAKLNDWSFSDAKDLLQSSRKALKKPGSPLTTSQFKFEAGSAGVKEKIQRVGWADMFENPMPLMSTEWFKTFEQAGKHESLQDQPLAEASSRILNELVSRADISNHNMEKLLIRLERSQGEVADHFSVVDENTQANWLGIRAIESEVGARPSTSVPPTLWLAFTDLQDKIATISTSSDSLQASVLANFQQLTEGWKECKVSSLHTDLSQTKDILQALQKEVLKVLTSHSESIQAIVPELKSLKSQATKWATTTPVPSARAAVPENPLHQIRSSFAALHSVQQVAHNSQEVHSLATPSPTLDTTELMERCRSLEQRLNKLELTKQVGGDRSGHEVVTVSGLTFRDTEDVKAWLTSNFTEPAALDFGCFADPLGVFHRLYLKIVNKDLVFKELETRVKLKLSNGECILMSAMDLEIPYIFTGSSSGDSRLFTGQDGSKNACRFRNCPKFANWEDRAHTDGLKFQILSHLAVVRKELQSDISRKLHRSPEAIALATTLLADSVTFIQHLCDFMSQAYRQINKSDRSAAASWDVVCYVVQQLFIQSFHTVRSSIGSAHLDTQDRLAFGSSLILNALRANSVANSLERDGIENHPIVSASYTKFILDTVNAGDVSELSTEVQAMEAKLITSAKQVEAASKKADVAKTMADKALKAAKDAMVEAKKP